MRPIRLTNWQNSLGCTINIRAHPYKRPADSAPRYGDVQFSLDHDEAWVLRDKLTAWLEADEPRAINFNPEFDFVSRVGRIQEVC